MSAASRRARASRPMTGPALATRYEPTCTAKRPCCESSSLQQGLQHGLGREHGPPRRVFHGVDAEDRHQLGGRQLLDARAEARGQLDEVRHHRGEVDRAAGDRRSERGAEDGDQPLLPAD